MSLMLDARHETPASPQELVEAAKDAQNKYLQSNYRNRGKSFVSYYSALRAAYSSVVEDEKLGKRFKELVDQTVDAIPGVGVGRIDREVAKQKYRINLTTGPRMLAAMSYFETGKKPINREQDVLWLLEKTVTPSAQKSKNKAIK